MSKKNKPTKTVHQPVKPATIKEIQSEENSAFQLIRFDKKVKLFIGIFLALYILAVVFKLNGSSVGIWNQILPGEGITPKTGILHGQPRSIRSDEWLGVTPFFVSQASKGYPTENELMGPSKTPLMWNIPNTFYTNWIRPAFVGAYFFDVEHAYSVYWNFRVFPTIIVTFLFFMLLTRNNFLISVIGSFWVFLTAAVQWWALYPGEIITFLCAIFITFNYIVFSKSTKVILLNSFLLVVSMYGFATEFYPAFLVPFSYLLAAICIGYVLDNLDWEIIKNKLAIKSGALIFSVTFTALLFYLLIHELSSTKDLMMQTAYPGKRVSLGGDYGIVELFVSYWGYFMEDGKVPTKWGNICEASSFLMFFPVPLYFTIKQLVLRKKVSRMLVMLSALIIFNLVFLFIGFSETIANLTFYSYAPSGRLVVILGFINLISVLVFLSQRKRFDTNTSKIEIAILSGLSILMLFFISSKTNSSVGDFFKSSNVYSVIIFFGIVYHVLFNVKFKYSVHVFAIIVILYLLPNVNVNPINDGLKPLLDNPLGKAVKEIHQKDPKAQWAVFGQFTVPSYLKAMGVPVINGLATLPDFKKIEILDPGMKNKNVYNRYGYMAFQPFVDGKDSVVFQNIQPDLYTIGLDPCSPKLKQMGVKYIAFTYSPQEVEIRCMKLVYQGSVLIYEITN